MTGSEILGRVTFFWVNRAVHFFAPLSAVFNCVVVISEKTREEDTTKSVRQNGCTKQDNV
jgi:hypothetical protein